MFDEIPKRQKDHYARTGHYLTQAERQCTYKRVHTERSALAEADRLQSLGNERIHAYACPLCGKWHVGRMKR